MAVKKVLLQMLCILVLVGTLLSLCACDNSGEAMDTVQVSNDCQWSLTENTEYSFVNTENGIFFAKGWYLYHMDESLQPKPLCIRGGCPHDESTEINVNCDAFVEYAEGLYYYDGHLFVLADSRKSGKGITEYTKSGIYVRNLGVLPETAKNMIQHRGFFYYSFNTEGNAAVVKLSAESGKSEVIYRSPYAEDSLKPLFAYDRYVYIRETNHTGENPGCTLIYDTEKEEMSAIDTANILLHNGMLIYTKNGEDGKTVWTAKPNGTREKETKLVLNNAGGLFCAFDEYVIESNSITDENPVQRFTVYRDNELFFEFTLEDVEGRNWGSRQVDSIIFADDHIFILPQMKNGDHVVVEVDRDAFDMGIFESRVVIVP